MAFSDQRRFELLERIERALTRNEPFLARAVSTTTSVAENPTSQPGPVAPRLILSANQRPHSVSLFRINPVNGRVVAVSTSPLEEGIPRAIAKHPSAPFAYVICARSNTVLTFRIDDDKGTLTPVGAPMRVPAQPVSLTFSSDGRHLYVLCAPANLIGRYAVNLESGALLAVGEFEATGENPAALVLHPWGRYVYVVNNRSNNLAIYEIHSNTGVLSLITRVATGDGPTAMAIHPAGRYAFVTNFAANTISAFAIDTESGWLFHTGDVVTADAGPVSIVVSAAGRYAQVACAVAGSLGTYRISVAGGLTRIDSASLSSVSRTLSVDDSGQYLYTLNAASNVLMVYLIDPANGTPIFLQSVQLDQQSVALATVSGHAPRSGEVSDETTLATGESQ